jgi:dTDP-4-dehydrorhamnose reductase
MNPKVLVLGKSGQLASELSALEESNMEFIGKEKLDLSKAFIFEDIIKSYRPDWVINCMAYTAVDKAESEPELAALINATAVKTIANACKLNDVKLIHISTDFVFDGSKNTPYIESDKTNPQGNYGKTKEKGEQFVLLADVPAYILRTSWLYSRFGNNFLKTILKLSKERPELKVVFDQVGTPTWAKDLALAIHHMTKSVSKIPRAEVFHYSNQGVCSWFDFAVRIATLANHKCDLKPILSAEYPTPARRPHFSVLNKSKFVESFGPIQHWEYSLEQCTKEVLL